MARGIKIITKANGFLTHSENCTKQAEHQHNKHHHDIVYPNFFNQAETFKPAGKLQKCQNTYIYCPALIHDPKGTPYHNDENNDIGLFYESFKKCCKYLPGLFFASAAKC